jgi:hypothetical protein
MGHDYTASVPEEKWKNRGDRAVTGCAVPVRPFSPERMNMLVAGGHGTRTRLARRGQA